MERMTKTKKLELLKNQENKCAHCGVSLKSTLLGDKDDFNTSSDWACADNKNQVIGCRSCILSGGK